MTSSRRARLGKKSVSLIASASLGLVIAGCGSDESGDPGSGDETSPITIGWLNTQSGPVAGYGLEPLRGFQLVVQDINSRGGIGGREIEVVERDDAGDPADAVRAAQEMASDEEILLLGGLSLTANSTAVRDTVMETSDLPTFAISAGGYSLGPEDDTFFYGTPSVYVQGRAAVDFALTELQGTRIALVRDSSAYGEEGEEGVQAQLEEAGAELAGTVTLESTATNAAAQLETLRQLDPDVVILSVYDRPATILISEAVETGFTPQFVGFNAASQARMFESLSAEAEALFHGSTWVSSTEADAAVWVDKFESEFPDLAGNPGEPTDLTMAGVEMGLLFEEILNSVDGEMTREAVLAAAESVTDFDVGPMLAPITYTADDHSGQKQIGIFARENEASVYYPQAYPRRP